MNSYLVLCYNRKKEDNIIFSNMFSNVINIDITYNNRDFYNIKKCIDKKMNKNIKQVIFAGFEHNTELVIEYIKKKYINTKIKVICNTSESLLYFEYERKNFFKLLKLSKEKVVDVIAFTKKNMFILYNSLGYKSCYIRQNYILSDKKKEGFNLKKEVNFNDKTNLQYENNKVDINSIKIGILPFDYLWNKNIYNQLSVGKFFENSIINTYILNKRMKEFLEAFKIKYNNLYKDKKSLDINNFKNHLINSNINIESTFTEYVNTTFLLSMELGVICLIGNNNSIFEDIDFNLQALNKLKSYLIIKSEDNPILISEKIKIALENKDEILKLYSDFKVQYNKLSDESIKKFLKK